MKENTNRHLDDQAKIFSLSCHKKDTSIFRLTVKLKEKINEDILLKSTNKALKKYKAYKVQLKKGFFWYTLIPNNQEIIIHKGIDYKFNFIQDISEELVVMEEPALLSDIEEVQEQPKEQEQCL